MDGKKVLNNFIWKFAERISAKLVSFIVSIMLARILAPADYGTVSLVAVSISILDVFVNCGFGVALIQKKDADNTDFSTVFFFNIGWSIVCYIVLFLVSPLIASFYNNPYIKDYTRVAGTIILVGAIKNILQAYIAKNMMFKKFFWATIGGTAFSGIVGIYMAINGFGTWALIAQNLSNAVIDTIILWITVKWKPQCVFSINRLFKLLKFGGKMFFASLMETIYNNIRVLIIGKYYSTEDLAFYDKGQSWPILIIENINSSMDSVLLPALSAEQGNKDRVKTMMRRSLTVSCYIVWPMLIGLLVIAYPLIDFVLTKKWIESVFYLRLACFVYMFWPIHTAHLNTIQALGRSDIFLKQEIIKKVIGIITLVVTVPMGVRAIAIGLVIMGPVCAIINAVPNVKLINYTIKEQIFDILPIAITNIIMATLVYLPSLCIRNIGSFYIIVIQVVIGVISYVALSALLKNPSFTYVLQYIKKMRGAIK